MLHRRRSKKSTPNPTSPQPTSGSLSSRRPLNPVAHQQPLRTPTVETESLVSEVSPQETLPVLSRPVTSPPSLPGSSGPRRQQTRHETQETLWSSTPKEQVLPQPQKTAPTPIPPVSQAPGPLGGGVGGSESVPKFTTHSDSSSLRYEATGVSEGAHAGVWATYNKVSQEFDKKRLEKWSGDLDLLLIFVSPTPWSGMIDYH